MERRAAVLVDKKNAKFSVDDLIADVNEGKNNGQLKKIVGNAVSAKRLLYRLPTPFEQRLIEADAESPIAKLHQYVVLEYVDNKAREDAIEPTKRDKSFLHVARDELVQNAALPTENSGWLGNGPTVNNQWGMHLLNFPAAWDKQTGRAWVTALDNGIWENSPDLNPAISFSPSFVVPNYRRHLSFNAFTQRYFDQVDELKDALVNGAGTPFAGHGTHVASVIAGIHNNGGTAGGCPGCSLIAIRKLGSTLDNAANVARSVDIGSQVINMSFETPDQTARYDCLAGDANRPLCIALTHANNSGVSLVAAAGNFANQKNGNGGAIHPDLYPLPATHPNVLAISGLQYNGSAMSFWTGAANSGFLEGPVYGSNFGQVVGGIPQISFAAPAQRVLASVYPGWIWNNGLTGGLSCGDQENVPGSAGNDGIGLCTGTSMSAPHISAMAGLVKSSNPLLDTAGVKAVLRQSADCLGTGTQCTSTAQMEKLGYGVPKADKAVQLAIGGPTAKNRVTPLYGYYNTDGDNHFYSTNPQMAIAAARNTLQPAPKYRISPAFVDCVATPVKCQNANFVDQVFTTTLPDGTVQSALSLDVVFQIEYSNLPAERATATTKNEVGSSALKQNPNIAGRTVTSLPALNPAGLNPKIRPLVMNTTPLTYKEIGLAMPKLYDLPCGSSFSYNLAANVATNSGCAYFPARAIAGLLTTHQDPTNTSKTLKKVYRFSCNPDNLGCNIASGAKAVRHVAFRYTTNEFDLQAILNEGYDLDGVEGYVFDPAGVQPAGTQMLCSRRNIARHDRMLFLDTATSNCTGTSTDSYLTQIGLDGSGYTDASGEKLGYAYPISYLSQDSDNDGLTDAQEMAEGRNPNVKDNNFLDLGDHRLFVQQQYRDFLGREAEPGGLFHHENLISNQTISRQDMLLAFLTSGEFGLTVPPVVRMYLGLFNRVPTHAELYGANGAVPAFRAGAPLSSLILAPTASAEFAAPDNFPNTMTNAQFITRLYDRVLYRTPSTPDLNWWLQTMQGMTRANVILAFSESDEGRAKNNSKVLVISAYESMLRRAVEPAGFEYWLNYLIAGYSAIALMNGFYYSQEYRNRFFP